MYIHIHVKWPLYGGDSKNHQRRELTTGDGCCVGFDDLQLGTS